MNDNTHIQNLIDKFLEASASEAEERELQEYFANLTEIPPEWEDLAIMLGGFARKKVCISSTKKQKPKVLKLLWLSAASVAILLGIRFFMGADTNKTEVSEPKTTLEIFQQGVAEIEDDELREEVERLMLEYDVMALEEEADKFVEDQNTFIVSL